MFWIGMIVGGIIGFAATLWCVMNLAKRICGSADKAAEIGGLIREACENRESTVCAYHDDELLGCVVLEELE